MNRRIGIELQTVFGMPPVEHVNLAADLECHCISTGLTPVPWQFDCFPIWSLRDDKKLRQEMKAVMRDRGIAISLAEGFAVRPRVDAQDHARDLDIMMELGAEQVSSVCLEPDTARAFDQFTQLADMVGQREMRFTVEFAPPHPVNSLDKALALIHGIGDPNTRLVIDAMHFFRSGGSLEVLASVDSDLIGYAQICDVPMMAVVDDYYQEACFGRMCPGDGELPLQELIATLPADIVCGLEVPMQRQIADGQLRSVVARIVRSVRNYL